MTVLAVFFFFIHLAALGLSCNTQDLWCSTQVSLVVAGEFSSYSTWA